MKTKEVQDKLFQIEATLKALGDLNSILQNGPAALQQTQQAQATINSLLPQITSQKQVIDQTKTEVDGLKTTLTDKSNEVAGLIAQVEELTVKVEDLIAKTTQQLARAADEKLANAFVGVKQDLITDRDKWFKYMIWSLIALIAAIGAVTGWQIYELNTLYHWAYPIRIAMTSPLIYLVFFLSKEFNRARSLIEEYTFKSAIAYNFEAYKEVLDATFKGQPSEILKSQFEFIIESVRSLYSSPMKNIRTNTKGEKGVTPDMVEIVQKLMPGQSKE